MSRRTTRALEFLSSVVAVGLLALCPPPAQAMSGVHRIDRVGERVGARPARKLHKPKAAGVRQAGASAPGAQLRLTPAKAR